jgi:hypothetical protein
MNELDYEPDEDAATRAGRWAKEEDDILWKAYLELGRDYAAIHKRLLARPTASIKGRLKLLIKQDEKRKADLAAGLVPEEKKEKKERSRKDGDASGRSGFRRARGQSD